MGKFKSAFMIGAMILAWSVYYAASKIMVDVTGSVFMAGLLLRLSALVFLTAQLGFGRKLGLIFKQGKTVWILILIGLFGFLLDLFANLGYAGGSLSTGTALLKIDVLLVNIVTVVIYKKKLYPSDWLGTIIMLFGVLLVLGISFDGMEFNLSDLFFILSAACVTANAFVIKAAQTKHDTHADIISYYNNFVVLLLFGSGAVVSGDLAVSVFEGIGSLWWLVVVGGLAQTLIYFFYYRNLKTHEVWLVKLYLLLMPIVSCFIGVFFLNEVLTVKKILGILVVLLGAVLILLRGRINHEDKIKAQ